MVEQRRPERSGAANPPAPDPSGPERPPSPEVARLVAEHHADLYRYAYRLTGSVADAEDLTQETFLAACERLDQVRDADKTAAWLFAVMRNRFLKSRRRTRPAAASSLALDIDQAPAPAADGPELDRRRLQDALNELSPEHRVVLAMFYFEDRSYREIAEALDLPLGTVMSRLSRAKGHLRQRLQAAAEHPAGRLRRRGQRPGRAAAAGPARPSPQPAPQAE